MRAAMLESNAAAVIGGSLSRWKGAQGRELVGERAAGDAVIAWWETAPAPCLRYRFAMAFTIRPAREDDVEALVAIGARMFAVAHRDAFARAVDLQAVIDRDWCDERLRPEIRDPSIDLFVAEVDGSPVGLTALRPGTLPGSERVALELCRVYLLDEHFGRGIGAALLNAAIDRLHELGDPDCFLIAWERNDRALPLYQARGFVRTGEFPYTVGESAPTAVLMERRLRGDGPSAG